MHTMHSLHLYANAGFHKVRSLSSHMAINQRVGVWTDVTHQHKTMHMHWHTTSPPHPAHSTAFFSSALSSLLLPIFVILRPIKALLAYITASLSLSLSLPRSSALSPSISCPYTLLHAHTQNVAPLCPVTQEVVISLQAQFTLTVPNERFPTLPFPVTPPPLTPPPFSAFGITILSESFIYPLSSFIPLPIISASLPSMTHSPSNPYIFLLSFFFPPPLPPLSAYLSIICPSASSFLPNLLLPSLEHNQPPFCSGPGTKNRLIIGYFCGVSIQTPSLTVIASPDFVSLLLYRLCSPF